MSVFTKVTPVGQARFIVGAILGVLTIIIFVIVLGNLGFKFDPFNLAAHKQAETQKELNVSKGDALTSEGQSAVTQSGLKRADLRAVEDRLSQQIHEANANDLRQTEGADAPFSDAHVDAINRGLCKYGNLYASDPVCASVRTIDPPKLPDPAPTPAATGAWSHPS